MNWRRQIVAWCALASLSSVSGCTADISDVEFKKLMAVGQRLDTIEVDLLYSTKLVRVVLGAEREYQLPANYFGPKGRFEPDTFIAPKNRFGFDLFLPDFGGYTKENWKDSFDRRRIQVVEVQVVDKEETVPLPGGGRERVTPASYGEPKSRFQNFRELLEDKPSYRMYGLEGYKRKSPHISNITWTGIRSNGEFFFFDCSDRPEGQPKSPNPLCQAQFFSEKEQLRMVYRYSQDHLSRWKEIDDAVWRKLKDWQRKN